MSDVFHPASAAAASSRQAIRAALHADESELVRNLAGMTGLDTAARSEISERAADLVRRVRADKSPSIMESFLAEYGLSTEEGIGLMCLAEALLRVPDADTIGELISDKIEPGNWSEHLGRSSSAMVNAATWALMLTGRVLDDDATWPTTALRGLVRRVGEPVVRTAVAQAMRMLGEQFVLGETMAKAMANARSYEAKGYTYSYDMLGEAARTKADANRYFEAYANAIKAAGGAVKGDITTSPGISIKLSALHPRYEFCQRDRVVSELVPASLELARLAASVGIGLNIDAEEANRLDLSLDVIERLLGDRSLKGWDGFGVVVQAYGRRAMPVIGWLGDLAQTLDRRIMVRLVKGAYWDSEIKNAQVLGRDGFPVFTRKSHTDVSYLACARRLIDLGDRIYGQFATHNAHTVAAVHAMAPDHTRYEFQRLHGMGEALHEIAREEFDTHCRIYAPVGAHEDLLAYLVRRLLENGANSSFVHQIVDEDIPPEQIARDPVGDALAGGSPAPNSAIRAPSELFRPVRANSKGFDVNEPAEVVSVLKSRERWRTARWTAVPMLATKAAASGESGRSVNNPANALDVVGTVTDATARDVDEAIAAAVAASPRWSGETVAVRARLLRAVAQAYEANTPELLAILAREAGKTLADAIAEVREAVDFLTYYAAEIERLDGERPAPGRGVFACISPWNFPLAIFTGQIAAAVAAGNAVIAKPAEQTPLIAARAVGLMHEAGIPHDVVQLLPGDGPAVGGPLTSDPRIAGVCFTGSTEVARIINKALAANAGPDAVLIAETGGLNAMIVDSTALPEQAVRDVIASSFQSAGQRCSALRILYVQSDVAERLQRMLFGAMDELSIGDPWTLSIDVGPVIDSSAYTEIQAYCDEAKAAGKLVKRCGVPGGLFVAPSVISVGGIGDIPREIFGPVLHIATFEADRIDAVVDDINARGYGLTFGLHTRIDDRVDQIIARIKAGNTYVNRNQIGAVVGSQPFGGEGLSGTGPKAGGPHYVDRFRMHGSLDRTAQTDGASIEATGATLEPRKLSEHLAVARAAAPAWLLFADRADRLCRVLEGAGHGDLCKRVRAAASLPHSELQLPGPTGETNRLHLVPRGCVLCLGPTTAELVEQAAIALAAGNAACALSAEPVAVLGALAASGAPVTVVAGRISRACLVAAVGFDVVVCGPACPHRALAATALADRDGPIVPLLTGSIDAERLMLERHYCIDTTAAGGNAALLAASAGE